MNWLNWQSVRPPPPPSAPNFEKGGIRKKNECLGGQVPATYICLGDYYVPYQERLCKMKYGFEGSIFKCQSWPALVKQPINV